MVSISVLLIALIGIQIYWMLSANKTQKTEWQLRYTRALDKVADQLKKRGFCFESFSKVYVDTNERFVMLHLRNNGIVDTVDIYYDPSYSLRRKTGKLKMMKLDLPFSIDIQLKSYVLKNDTPLLINAQNRFDKELNIENLNEVIRSYRPIHSLIDMAYTDSLIRVNLANEGMNSAFGFGFINTETNKVAYAERIKDSSLLLQSSYTTTLFSDNRFLSPHKLAITFPDSTKITRMSYILLLSVVIILILTFSFFKFVQLYFKQVQLTQSTSDFVQNLTHEFNTPLANIALAIETIENSGKTLETKTQNLINIISSESARLRENIERSLQVGMMEHDALMLHKEEVDLVQLTTTVISSYALKCESLGGAINLRYSDNPIIEADETHLLNCIVNILDNAIKYRREEPVIDIDISRNEKYAILSIRDNGMGMDSITTKHIFEKFYRAHQGDTHNTKGFGVGLCYVKGIITAHQGTIDVRSKKGIGSQFILKLPFNTK
jgi:two-component system, OmpR family, phosphate regulon sensor histidine kinase PhoR